MITKIYINNKINEGFYSKDTKKWLADPNTSLKDIYDEYKKLNKDELKSTFSNLLTNSNLVKGLDILQKNKEDNFYNRFYDELTKQGHFEKIYNPFNKDTNSQNYIQNLKTYIYNIAKKYNIEIIEKSNADRFVYVPKQNAVGTPINFDKNNINDLFSLYHEVIEGLEEYRLNRKFPNNNRDIEAVTYGGDLKQQMISGKHNSPEVLTNEKMLNDRLKIYNPTYKMEKAIEDDRKENIYDPKYLKNGEIDLKPYMVNNKSVSQNDLMNNPIIRDDFRLGALQSYINKNYDKNFNIKGTK